MSDPRPPSNGPGKAERIVAVLQSLTLQNLLVFAILIVLSVPSYFAYLFLTDVSFRHEFLSTAIIVQAEVPCFVVRGNISGFGDRHTVTTSYGTTGNWDYSIAIRAPSLMSNQEIRTACEIVHTEADLMKAAVRQRDSKAAEGK